MRCKLRGGSRRLTTPKYLSHRIDRMSSLYARCGFNRIRVRVAVSEALILERIIVAGCIM